MIVSDFGDSYRISELCEIVLQYVRIFFDGGECFGNISEKHSLKAFLGVMLLSTYNINSARAFF